MFFWNSCFFDDPADVGNLISSSSAFSKSSLSIWKLRVHVLLKPGLENFEHYFATVWDECNCGEFIRYMYFCFMHFLSLCYSLGETTGWQIMGQIWCTVCFDGTQSLSLISRIVYGCCHASGRVEYLQQSLWGPQSQKYLHASSFQKQLTNPEDNY